jgi:hypothetical protein
MHHLTTQAATTTTHGDHVTTSRPGLKALVVLAVLSVLVVLMPSLAQAATLPDPMVSGPHPVTTMSVGPTAGVPGDPGEAKLGLVDLQEPNGASGPPGTGTPPAANNATTLQVRGSLYYPSDTSTPAPLILLVHGNHGSCHVNGPSGSGANCATFNRNDAGYAYLAQNLASWGYVVFSLDQDQLIFYQDGNYGKGMHQRRLMMAAALDSLYAANQPNAGGVVPDANNNLGTQLVGKIDFNRLGLMGHSRGGDAVSSFLSFNRERPAPGRRYTIRAVIALAPVDYERQQPKGVVYGMFAGACDGDVSNLQGTRMYSRSLHADPTDPFPRIQMILHGANHDAFNSEWDADQDDSTSADPACGPSLTTNPTSIRLGRGTYTWTGTPNFFSGDPALMGDQEKAGLAMMAEFFRRYVGGETPFDPYMTGELQHDGTTPQLPQSACPTSVSGLQMSCFDRLSTSYFAAPGEREDVLDPDPDNPLTVSAMGTSLTGSGFADPYANSPGTVAQPHTASGYDWCNPETNQFTPSQLGITPTLPTATKPCPLPGANALGGQSNGARENAPVNGSYQPQLTLAWDHPLTAGGQPAQLETRIPAKDGDVTQYKSLALATSVNYFDPRNPDRATAGLTNPEAALQNFTVTLTDAGGHTGTVAVGDPKYGLGLQQSVANITARMHVILRENRIPLTDFTAQGVDTANLRDIKFQFGGAGMPQSGSIQLADVRFQEAVSGPTVYAESATATGPSGASPRTIAADNAPATAAVDGTPRAAASPALPDVVWLDGAGGQPAAVTAAGGAAKVTAAAKQVAALCQPKATVTSAKVAKGRLVLRGTAKDAGCSAAQGKVTAVQVTLARRAGKACRFVTASGTLGKAVACDAPVALVAKVSRTWSIAFAHKLPKGSYALIARAVDSHGTLQAAGKARTVTVR